MKFMTSRRIDRFNSLLKELAADFLIKEAGGALITIIRIEASKDLKTAKIFISIFPESDEEKVLESIKKKLLELRRFIGSKTKMKFIPLIEFEIDKQAKAERKIEEILSA